MAFPEQPFDEREKVREILQNTWVTGRKALAHEMAHLNHNVPTKTTEADHCTWLLQRYFLAEILKASSIPPTDLLNFIRERGIAPSWMEMALPNGA
jgi:hypothetical protein